MIFESHNIQTLIDVGLKNREFISVKNKIKMLSNIDEKLTGEFSKYIAMIKEYIETDGKSGHIINTNDVGNIFKNHKEPDIMLKYKDGKI